MIQDAKKININWYVYVLWIDFRIKNFKPDANFYLLFSLYSDYYRWKNIYWITWIVYKFSNWVWIYKYDIKRNWIKLTKLYDFDFYISPLIKKYFIWENKNEILIKSLQLNNFDKNDININKISKNSRFLEYFQFPDWTRFNDKEKIKIFINKRNFWKLKEKIWKDWILTEY